MHHGGPDPIEIQGLRKSFGSTVALDGLDLRVAAGEVHGFLGPNGSGKSTTIRILLGLLRKDGGTASLFGGDPWADTEALHRRLAYVPGDVSLWPNLTGGEVIDLLARLRGGIDQARRADLLQRFELDPTKKGRSYSKGNRQKVALVAALASDAELLVLDEPTSGLDPLMERVFQQYIDEIRVQGRTVLLSSHILSEVERLCDRVSIIRNGRTVQTGSLEELRALTSTTVTAGLDAVPQDGALTGMPGVHDVRIDGSRVSFAVDAAHLGEAIEMLSRQGIRSLTSTPPSLEELFMSSYDGAEAGR
jgi:ABC-2 type transport system ATP-binding protein